MKRIFILLMAIALCLVPTLRAQDAAVDERLNKLTAQIEDLRAAKELQDKQIAELARDLESLRAQQSQPNTSYASQDDLRKLAEKLQEIDKSRVADNELLKKTIEKLRDTLTSTAGAKKPAADSKPVAADNKGGGGTGKETGIKYTILKNDTLSAIVQACKEKGIKVTVDQIVNANPGLKPNNMPVGREIIIPASPP